MENNHAVLPFVTVKKSLAGSDFFYRCFDNPVIYFGDFSFRKYRYRWAIDYAGSSDIRLTWIVIAAELQIDQRRQALNSTGFL
ncbi:hypothetical protein NB636_10140 [Oxalobacter aliiformigenes]|uniref:hypothetical protein n=1 Tax=Oxalobacter aliiformigenes TaxID=2946593 RepID=UPI0022AF01BD|nr:hypothetical protein [Oxalobacter aliiformigenes]MCZ4065437.1 hypothetical protein [Oxalobacter aliiformigenes]WAV99028.1 hypothetical protein NB636_10140 [Oxalobacter aliiformigenes]